MPKPRVSMQDTVGLLHKIENICKHLKVNVYGRSLGVPAEGAKEWVDLDTLFNSKTNN